jgi:cellulose synthase/poly-beta-1,6-N-acetylglucosamine synthase-like glycosyltransferase/CheY-like chemotaxis protein
MVAVPRPLESRSAQGRPSPPWLAGDHAGSLILVADADPSRRAGVGAALHGVGYRVAQAANGVEAQARLDEGLPRLVVVAADLGDMDGLSFIEHLRSVPANHAIPAIFLSDDATAARAIDVFRRGADDCLPASTDMPTLLAHTWARLQRPPAPRDFFPPADQAGVLTERAFRKPLERELKRAARTGRPGCLAHLAIAELPRLRERLGVQIEGELGDQIAALIARDGRATDLVARLSAGRFAILLPETDAAGAQHRLTVLGRRIAAHTFQAADESLRLTPACGFTRFAATAGPDALGDEAFLALDDALDQLDLLPVCYDARLHGLRLSHAPSWRARLWRHLRVPVQLALAQVLAFVLPFLVYVGMAQLGFDLSHVMYLVVAAALLITAYVLWVEGLLALRREDPPEVAADAYPPASAIIAAYLPNEAATIVETIEAFLRVDYPGTLQIILAYNTPRDLPIEAVLRDLAARDPRFTTLRVPGSTSKAQNVNAALAHVRGEFVGVFDADHHPDSRSFARAWRWLAHGYDIVQGHCVVRNGDASWVARMVAFEFETIYGLNHPGRNRLHRFGIFGGANGYWKTELLRDTRMHRFMLTEDIDSSLRVVEAGYRIVTDPQILSRELAPVTVRALVQQRLRWSQGWFQVALKYTGRSLRSRHLSPRQKLGLLILLPWRELYPCLSVQVVPIIAFWLWHYGPGSVHWFVPLFVLTSLFTASTGPGLACLSLLVAAPELRRRWRWFFFYLVVVYPYGSLKNLVVVVAQLKELMRERHWVVTPRDVREDPAV